ncbi:TauD/TfdA family dioxygenase [Candidatus Pelagibacter sp.]|jgi:gamma-butyrobetaine dioxygenase|nr:TauD/TfdA family dioxygenase [Candidatus Pelagibacter sp.]|tara:strand:- start:239 stop:1363 length:1125 start_codon:yes stop_codon:yes gene_type:complete
MLSIKKIEKKQTNLNIEWSDGEKSNFNYFWLRDNCPTAHDKDSNHRMFNILETSKDLIAEESKVNEEGKLVVKWSEGNHTSYYDQKWLRENCYTLKNKQKFISPYQLWNSSLEKNLKSITLDHNEILNSKEGLLKWLKLLHYKGIAIVKNAPIEKESAFPVLNRISHTRQTFFDTPFEVINIPKPNNSAYTAHALRNHMDLPWFENPPGYQFLHCLVNSAEGGNSSAVDGFAVADYLKKNEKEIFETLVNTPLKFRDKDYTQETIRNFHATAISLTKDGDYNDIRFSVATMDTLDCHPDIMDKVYKAHHKFGNLLHDDKFQINFRLEPGDIFSFNNRRVLHGRTAFNPNSGHRHLQGYYMDRDEILGRLNFLKK